jgi:hypothetical protein
MTANDSPGKDSGAPGRARDREGCLVLSQPWLPMRRTDRQPALVAVFERGVRAACSVKWRQRGDLLLRLRLLRRRTPVPHISGLDARRAAMTPQEQALLNELFDRLAKLESNSRDRDAERLIAAFE